MKTTLTRAVDAMRRPGALLVVTHAAEAANGRAFHIIPRGGRVPDEVARQLLVRDDVQPYDSGLLAGHPQSWRLGDWRKPRMD